MHPNYTPEQLPDRIAAKIEIDPDRGCWMWTGGTNGRYGQVWWRRRMRYAHRVVYTLLAGEIPPGLVIDHLCREHLCVHPEHLEPVTQAENVRRGRATYTDKCRRGHDMTLPDAWYVRATGRAQCWACKRLAMAAWTRRTRSQAA